MPAYTNDIYGMLLQIADLSGAPDTYSHDNYGQIKRIADAVAPAGVYSNDKYSQLVRIADIVGAAGTYSPDVFGQVARIAAASAAGTFTGDVLGQLQRVVAGGLAAPLTFSAVLFATLPSWTGGAATLTLNAAAAPDKTTSAASLLSTTSTGGHNMSVASISRSAAVGFYRAQCYAKPINGYNIAIRLDDGTSSNYITQIFDINTGVVKSTFSVGTGITVVGSKMTLVNGYYRCEAIFRVDASRTTIRNLIQLADAAFTVASFTGVAANGANIWNPQVIVSTTPALTPIGAVPKIIFDTALCTDDSFDAFYYICKKADVAACTLVAATVSPTTATSASCLRAMLNFSGYSAVPIGAYQGAAHETADNYTALVTTRFRPGDTRANYPTALSVARTALAAAADGSITYLCCGNTGNLEDLLKSPGDAISPLTGMALVTKKVGRLVLMAGNYPTGTEHNFQVLPASSNWVMANWPTEIVEVPFSMGTVYCRPPIGYDPLVNPYGYAFDNLPGGYYQSLNGVTSMAIGAAGSGGTNGTYAMSFSGGGGLGSAGTFTVTGGAVTAVKLLSPGQGYATDPTISTAACPGLTGATITPTRSAYNARSAWDGVSAFIAVNGIDLANFNFQGTLGLNAVDAATGNNTFGIQEPGVGRQQYILYSGDGTASLPAIASNINQAVFS